MKNIFDLRLFAIGLVGTIAFIVNSCSKLEVENEIKKERISGFVQKGPYVNGTQILMAELNSSMEQTGKLFSTQITDNKGTFEINNIELTSSYVEFSASGFYFDEVKGDISAAQLTLFALSDVTDISSVNVNILTHLERRRVEYLVANGKSFSDAKSQAQAEILAIFGFEKANMKDSENLDISVDNEDNAILLAISVILQGNRSVGDLTELLATISNAIRATGVLENETILNQLRTSALQLNLTEIRQHLVSRYHSLGINANIPDFDTYVGAFLSYTAGEPFALTQDPVNVTPTSAIFTAMVNPNSASTTVSFEYGTTEEYGNIVTFEQGALNGNKGMPVQVAVSSLDPATTYHFRVKAENEHGFHYGLNHSFTTLGTKPEAIADFAQALQKSATLNGKVNPNLLRTTVSFEWGTGGTFQFSEEAIESPLDGNSYVPVSVEISGLIANTDYQFRIKAENALGITFSDEMNFRTFYSTVSDIDGNDYPTVIIGEQEWMAQNLKTTKYSDGTVILKGPENNTEWSELQVAAYTIYPHSIVDGINSDVQMVNAYGLLYNGYSITNKKNICPVGWRVPSMDDWIKLAEFIDPSFNASNNDLWKAGSIVSDALRSPRTEPDAHPRWQMYNSGANNKTLFSALPGGSRRENGTYEALGTSFSAFWSNSSRHGELFWCLDVVDLYDRDFTRGECYGINAAWPVRCIKD